MKRNIFLFLILLSNIYTFGNIVSNSCLFNAKFSDSLSVSVKNDYLLKNDEKSNLHGFYVRNGFHKNSYSVLKPNTLFFADGDILNEDFEAASGWAYTNAATGNKWAIGKAVNNGGTKALYISKDDGANYAYDTKVATVVHAYKVITVPAAAEEISVSFDWKCLGDGTDPKKHYFKAWLVLDTYLPKQGSKIYTLKDQRILLGEFNSNDVAFKNEFFVVDSKVFSGKKLKIVFEWINDTAGGWQPPAAIDNLKISKIDCPTPSKVVFEDIEAEEALMKWDAPKSAPTEYDIYYSKDKTPPTAATVPINSGVKTTSSLLKSLDSNTVYYVWIRSVCGTNKGLWSIVYKFETACGVFNIPFFEGFNKDSNTIKCWTILDGNNDKTIWKPYSSTSIAYEGDRCMEYEKYSSDTTFVNNDWLISPTFKMNGTYRLKYHYKATSYSGDSEFEVLLSKDGIETKDFKKVLVAKKVYKNKKYIEKIIILDNVVGDINIAWHVNGKGASDIYIDNVIIEEVINCPEPLDLDVKDIEKKQATIFWQDDLGGKKWEYFVQEDGEGEPTVSGISTNKKEVIVTKDNNGDNLEPNTEYEYYVRTDCEDGKFSIWSGPFKFRTACDVFTVPFWEGFNSDSNSLICWKILDVNDDNTIWKPYTYGAFEGDQAMYFSIYNSAIVSDDWLITPTIKVNGIYRLRYHYKTSSSYSCDFEVLLSDKGEDPKDFKKTLLPKKTYANKDYIEQTVLFKAVGDINIAWHLSKKGTSIIYIDNVFIEEVEGCPEPVNLDIKDIKGDKATIFWEDEFGAKSWEYFVQVKGKGKPTKNGTTTSTKENIATINNDAGGSLLPDTEYEFYVRSVCEGGEKSIWSGPFVFKTNCLSFTVPFWEGFNKDSESIGCWEILDNNTDGYTWKPYKYSVIEGDQSMYYYKYSSDTTFVSDDWLISPEIQMNGTYRLKYKFKGSSSYDNNFEVLLSKDGKDIKEFKKTLVAKKPYKNTTPIEKKVIINNMVGDINIAWHANGKKSSNIYIDEVSIEEVENCAEPYELDVKDILTDKVTIFWIDESDSKSWEYFVQTPGKGEPTASGTITSNRENIITTENETGGALLHNTAYEYYVRTVCDDGTYSIWSDPFVFRTACGVFDLPLWEGFNSDSEGIYCWDQVDGNKDDSTWRIYTYGAFEGGQFMYYYKYSTDSTFVNDEWLISPTLKTNGGLYRIKYHYKASSSHDTEFELLMSTKGKDISEFKKTILPKQVYKNTNYIEKKIFVDKLKGDINFAWHITNKKSATVYLDNIFIEEVENCAEPLDLGVKDVESFNATILWTDDFNAKSWEYFVQASGKGEPTKSGTITSNKENVVKIDNETGGTLIHNTEYEFYVKTVCPDGTNSIWAGPFVFRTACDAFDLPFWEGFNSDTETIYCWGADDVNADGSTWRITSSGSYEGDRAAYFYKYSSDTTFVNDDWLISPIVKTTGGMHRIKYHYKTSNINNDFEFLMSTKGNELKDFTKTILPKKTYKTPNYVEEVIFVPNLNGNVAFAWHATNKGSSSIYLDNIFIEKVKGCPEPTYVKITGQTDSSISIEWEQYGDGNKWEVIAVPYGEEIPDEKDLKPIVVTTNPKATITGLNPGKVYTFYVRVICKDGTPSDWSTGKVGATKVNANNDCSGAYNIPVNGGDECILFTSGTLLESTLSTTTKKNCANSVFENDVWFEFTAKSNVHIINISDVISDLGINFDNGLTAALYADACTADDTPMDCFNVKEKNSNMNKYTGLTIGKKYYLRIHSTKKKADFVFKICIRSSESSLYVSSSGEDYTVEELVKDVLIDSNCDLVSNIKYQAGNNSKINTFGYFEKKKSDFPYEKGIVLATHEVRHTSGPYIYDWYHKKGKVPAWIGDPDLNEVIKKIGGSDFGSNKYVSVLEFDFIPIKDSIKFEYIFASESYRHDCAVVCKPGGALFAAWLTDIETGEGRNLALVPGTQNPIALNTIRDTKKTRASCESVKPEFFGECYSAVDGQYDPLKAPIDYSGVTVPMTSEKVGVKVGKKYRIKIAIADFCSTDSHVSAVFFKGGSFDLGNLDLGADMLVETNTALCEKEEKTIYSGLDKDQATIEWYKDGVLIPGESDSQLTVHELGNYEVIGRYESLKCEVKGEIRIEIFPRVEELISDAENINFCINSISGKDIMDITVNEDLILKGLNKEEFEIFYYLTKEDSENDVNRIENPTEFEIPKDKKLQKIFVRIIYKISGCPGYKEFSLVPQKITVPESPGDQQACARYIFNELPKDQHYFTEKGAKGREYRAGDIIDKPGNYTLYICSINGDCYEEVSFDLEITAPVKAKVFKDETMQCVNHELEELPSGNRYFTEPNGEGVELFPGNIIRFTQTIYVYAKSDIGPNYCIDESSFKLTFEECPVPKGISPNGDGVNDFLDLEVHGVTSIVIYNRYGMEVYAHGEGYTNQWYGQSNSGNPLPDGTYYYVIEARGKTRTGWVQVNR